MSSVNQFHGAPSPLPGFPTGDLDPDRQRADAEGVRAFVGQAMIERAKSVIVVARRVDEDKAARILLDAANQADIPVRLAADQVMTALQADDDQEGITQDALVRALAAVRPMEQPRGRDPLPAERPAGRAA